MIPQEVGPLFALQATVRTMRSSLSENMKKALIPFSITSTQHRISKGLGNPPKLFHGSPDLKVFKDNLPELENTKMPALFGELQVHSVRTSAYG